MEKLNSFIIQSLLRQNAISFLFFAYGVENDLYKKIYTIIFS